MDYSPIVNEVFKLWWLIPILLVITVFKTPWFKGLLGETLVKFAAWLRFPAETYHPIHNVTLPTPDGTTHNKPPKPDAYFVRAAWFRR